MSLKVFVISLKQDEKRRQELKQNFKRYNEFNVIDATDGREFSANEYYKKMLNSFSKHHIMLSPAEIGCSLSHLKAYEEFLQSKYEFALILEDDVIGDDDGLQTALNFTKDLPLNSILILGAQDGLDGRFSAFGKKIKTIDKKDMFLVSKYSRGSIYRAAAYIITKHSAKILADIHKDAVCIADHWEYIFKKSKTDIYFVDIFKHPTDLKDSHIQKDREQKSVKKELVKGFIKSIKFIFFSRIQTLCCGYERIFKR